VRHRTGNAIPIAQRAEDEKFISRYIVPVNSPAKSLQDLKGKTFAFGSPSSTSGHLMPRFPAHGRHQRDGISAASPSQARTTRPSLSSFGPRRRGRLNARCAIAGRRATPAPGRRVLATTPPYYATTDRARDLDPVLVTDRRLPQTRSGEPGAKDIMRLQRVSHRQARTGRQEAARRRALNRAHCSRRARRAFGMNAATGNLKLVRGGHRALGGVVAIGRGGAWR
jgi:phosphonate transport system substrate-binding protein